MSEQSTAVLSSKLEQVLKKRERQAAWATGWDWYAFRVAPSCPPDQRIHMRGGLLWNPYPGDYYAWQVPSCMCDLCNSLQVYANYYTQGSWTYENKPYFTWTIPYGYKVFSLLLRLPYTASEGVKFILTELQDWTLEFSTAAEAEEAWPDTISDWQESWYTDGYPLCGLILRNDGTLGTGCRFQAVDVLNRGRSYIWPRDIRPLDYLV